MTQVPPRAAVAVGPMDAVRALAPQGQAVKGQAVKVQLEGGVPKTAPVTMDQLWEQRGDRVMAVRMVMTVPIVGGDLEVATVRVFAMVVGILAGVAQPVVAMIVELVVVVLVAVEADVIAALEPKVGEDKMEVVAVVVVVVEVVMEVVVGMVAAAGETVTEVTAAVVLRLRIRNVSPTVNLGVMVGCGRRAALLQQLLPLPLPHGHPLESQRTAVTVPGPHPQVHMGVAVARLGEVGMMQVVPVRRAQ